MTDETKAGAKARPGFFRRLFVGEEAPEAAPPAPEAEAEAAEAEEAETNTPEAAVALERPAAPEIVAPVAVVRRRTCPRFRSRKRRWRPRAAPAPKRSWFTRLREGLSRSSSSIGTGIADIFTKRKLDEAALEELEDVLIRADLGVATATRISEAVGKGRYDKDVSPDEVKAILAAEVERVLAPYATPIAIDAKKPFVILVVGVNGSGKTTTIGKLAAKFAGEGKRVTLAAGDTFRAAAIAQLRIWGERLGCSVIAREQGSDAASLAYEAIEAARTSGADVLLMDTAGRLQNRTELMDELEKINPRDEEARPASAARLPARARRHRRPERDEPGRDLRQGRRRHRPGDDQARRHRPRRHFGGHHRALQAAGAFHRRRRDGGGPGAVRGEGFRRGDRGGWCAKALPSPACGRRSALRPTTRSPR